MEPRTGTGASEARAMSVVLRDVVAVRRYCMPNIKGGGILVETKDLLPMGSEVLLMVTVPDGQPRAAVMGKVVWITPANNRDGYPPAIGVQFVSDRAGAWTRIQNVLSGVPDAGGPTFSF